MKLAIAPRAGIWIRSLAGWDAFRAAVTAGCEPAIRLPDPVPDLLPVREGRRAPLHVRLAIEAGIQACRENGVRPSEVLTVFASAMGDTEITDYMCRTLTGTSPMLSPTRFHNSVHNAASGYWSIGAENRRGSSAIAAQAFTVPAALLESATLAVTEQAVVLLVVSDVPVPPPLDAVSVNRQPFAAALLVSVPAVRPDWCTADMEYVARPATWPALRADWLRGLAVENESARIVPLLEGLAGQGPAELAFPLGEAARLHLQLAR